MKPAIIATLALTVGACAPPPPAYTPPVRTTTPSAYTPPPEPRPTWRADCRRDRFVDQDRCTVKLDLSTISSNLSASLWTADLGATWSITTAPAARVFRLRVDQHPVVEGLCTGPASTCDVTGAPRGRSLTSQLRSGQRIAVSIVGYRGGLDRDIDSVGFVSAIEEAERRTGRRAPSSGGAPAR